MGTDCYIEVDGEIDRLDRWYIFSPKLRSKKPYSRRKVLRCLRILYNQLINEYGFSDSRVSYCRHWHKEAKTIIKQRSVYNSKIIFYPDYDLPDDFYERY